MHYPDLSVIEKMPAPVVAVGWLEPEHPYARGSVEEPFFARLTELLVNPWQPFSFLGGHRCGFCRFSGGPSRLVYHRRIAEVTEVSLGVSNLFVPAEKVLYMVPSLVAHYIDAHEYSPPAEFVDAVMHCPPMRSIDYLRAIKAAGGVKLMKGPGG